MVNNELGKRKGKKMNKKGVDVRFFFFWPCCFEVLDKSYNASYEHIFSKYYLVFIGVIRKLFIAGLPRARSARGTEPHTHGIWSTSFRLVVT